MLASKPYFTLHIESDEFLGYLELNGQILVFSQGAHNQYEMPAGHFIQEGDNELLLMVAPDKEDEFSTALNIKITLRERESGNDADDFSVIATLKFAGALAQGGEGIESNTEEHRLDSTAEYAIDEDGDIVVGEVTRETYGPAAVVRRIITLPPIALPRWQWLDSDDLTDEDPGPDLEGRVEDDIRDGIKKELMPIYKQIWDAIQDDDVDSVLPLFNERSEEMDTAFFKAPGDSQARLAELLSDAIKDPELKLWPLSDGNAMVELHDNNKLARLKQNNYKPLISFDYKEGGAESYDLIFRKSGDDWIITR